MDSSNSGLDPLTLNPAGVFAAGDGAAAPAITPVPPGYAVASPSARWDRLLVAVGQAHCVLDVQRCGQLWADALGTAVQRPPLGPFLESFVAPLLLRWRDARRLSRSLLLPRRDGRDGAPGLTDMCMWILSSGATW